VLECGVIVKVTILRNTKATGGVKMERELDQLLIFLYCFKVVVKKGVKAQDHRNAGVGPA
jgi:hypothetical protein